VSTEPDEPAAADASFDYVVPADETDEDETILIDGRALGGSMGARQPARPPAPPAEPARSGDRLGWIRRIAPAPAAAAPVEVGEATAEAAGGPRPHGLALLSLVLRRPHPRGTRLMIAALLGLLGFFAVVQLRLQAGNGGLENARQSDLIRILDDLNAKSDRLSGEISDLENRRAQLQSGSNAGKAALSEALKRKAVLGILSGTVPAHGPGVTLKIADPNHKIDGAVLLDTMEELRDAGAEAMQIDGVRVVANSAFLDAGPGQIRLDGHLLTQPYVLAVIGDPDTLEPALRIPGGVFAVLDERGATPTLQSAQDVVVDAVRPATAAQYAKPVGSS
jgi:uncharacterized protein YlxW (UPF0749 family)